MTASRARSYCLTGFGLLCAATVSAAPAAAVPGGWSDLDPTGTIATDAAAVTLAKVNSDVVQGDQGYKLLEIRSAQQQVVSGYNVRLDLIAGPTTCSKADVDDSCASDDAGTTLECTSTVYVVPWENSSEVTDLNCEPQPPN